MAEAKPPSTSDLLLLITGLDVVKAPDLTADFGEDYYLNPRKGNEERTLRETISNTKYLLDPFDAWRGVKFRDWLLSTLFGNITDHKHDFTTISQPVLYSMDLLGKKYSLGDPGTSNEIKKVLTLEESGRERTFFQTLTFGISKQQVGPNQVFLFGAGIRRRVELWMASHDEALQVDAEFFLPFFILPNHKHGDDVSSSFARSMSAGIVLRNSREQALYPDKDPDLIAIRFNLRIPFKTETLTTGNKELQTQFGKPEINLQKKVKNSLTWAPFAGWKTFLEAYCKDRKEVHELLNSPMGPLLAEKISGPESVTDLISSGQKKVDEFKAVYPQFKEDLDDTLYLLKHVYEWQPPDKAEPEPNSGSQRLGTVLANLGLMSSTKPPSGGEMEYSFKVDPNITPWSVLDH